MPQENGEKKRILLVAPSYSFIYQGAMIRPGAIYSPHLGLATIAGPLVARGHEVRIADLNKVPEDAFLEEEAEGDDVADREACH